MMKVSHPFHLVSLSPWPLFCSLSFMVILFGSVDWFNGEDSLFIFNIGVLSLLMSLLQWWRDVVRESTYQGAHMLEVQSGLRVGFLIFILSEVFFFASFFWGLFHVSLSPSMFSGSCWPPSSLPVFDPLGVPFLNTVILVFSGATVTSAHYCLLTGSMKLTYWFLYTTVNLGFVFTFFQLLEYSMSGFTIMDSIYGSLFFLVTGFHGAHVFIGTMFLMICTFRVRRRHLSSIHHVNFEFSSWYWHFVDVVWLFVYLFLYW